MADCRRHVEEAIARLPLLANQDPRDEMRLQAALGMSLNYTTGPVPATAAAWSRTLEIATALPSAEYQLRALRGLWAYHMNAGEYRRALGLARQFRNLAAREAAPADQDGRAARRDGARRVDGLVDPVVPALERRPLLGEHRAADLHGLLETVHPLADRGEVEAEPAVLGLVPGRTDPQICSTM